MRRRHCLPLLWLAAGVAVAACGSVPTAVPAGVVHADAGTAGLLPTATRTPAPTWTPPFQPTTPPASPTLRPTATWVLPTLTPVLPQPEAQACTEAQGSVSSVSVPSDTLNYAIDALIYLPPCYAASDRRYPVVYLIHGLNFAEDQWSNLGAPQAADALIADGQIAPLIMVMPRDRLDDRLDRAFVNDLLPYIDSHYRTLADRDHRAIGGLSRGAGWAIHIGLEYPDRFSRIGAHSPAVFIGDEDSIIWWTWHLPEDEVPAVYVDIGQSDSLIHSAAWFDQVLTYSKVRHTYVLRPGTHSEAYWSAHVAEYLSFYATGWLHPPPPTPETQE